MPRNRDFISLLLYFWTVKFSKSKKYVKISFLNFKRSPLVSLRNQVYTASTNLYIKRYLISEALIKDTKLPNILIRIVTIIVCSDFSSIISKNLTKKLANISTQPMLA